MSHEIYSGIFALVTMNKPQKYADYYPGSERSVWVSTYLNTDWNRSELGHIHIMWSHMNISYRSGPKVPIEATGLLNVYATTLIKRPKVINVTQISGRPKFSLLQHLRLCGKDISKRAKILPEERLHLCTELLKPTKIAFRIVTDLSQGNAK